MWFQRASEMNLGLFNLAGAEMSIDPLSHVKN